MESSVLKYTRSLYRHSFKAKVCILTPSDHAMLLWTFDSESYFRLVGSYAKEFQKQYDGMNAKVKVV